MGYMLKSFPLRFVVAWVLSSFLAACVGFPSMSSARPDFRLALSDLVQAKEVLDVLPASLGSVDEQLAREQLDKAIALLMSQIAPQTRAVNASTRVAGEDRLERVHRAMQLVDLARVALTRNERDEVRLQIRNDAIRLIAYVQQGLGKTMEQLVR